MKRNTYFPCYCGDFTTSLPALSVPDQSFTIAQMFERYIDPSSVNQYGPGFNDPDIDSPTDYDTDLTDMPSKYEENYRDLKGDFERTVQIVQQSQSQLTVSADKSITNATSEASEASEASGVS